MPRFAPYLGIAAALILGVFFVIYSEHTTGASVPVAVVMPNTSSAPVVVGHSAATSSLPSVERKNAVASSTPKNASSASSASSPFSASAVAPSGNSSLDTAATTLRNALVNILCYVPAGSVLHSISGSGVFIDSKGTILTNAHIAEYFLLADRGVSCTIRSGSPAVDRYDAALIYISPAWLSANADVLTEASPDGTGEDDFALLAVSKSATANALPASFPFIPLAPTPPAAGTPIVIASYGAQFLTANQVASDLYPTVVFGSVKDIFTFGTNTIDVLALGGSAAAQEGSSGGGVADSAGALAGTITTSTVSGATDTRSLDAITASYIRAEYANETGQALDLLLAEPTAAAIADFASRIPALESIITPQLH